MKENEGKFDFLWLVVKFGFEGEGTFTFCKMRWLVVVMTAALNLHGCDFGVEYPQFLTPKNNERPCFIG